MTVFHATHPNELQLLHHGQTLRCISGFFLYDENYQCKIAPSCYYPCQWGYRKMFCIVLHPSHWCILPASVKKWTTNWVFYHNQLTCQSTYKRRSVFLVSLFSHNIINWNSSRSTWMTRSVGYFGDVTKRTVTRNALNLQYIIIN